MTRRRGFTLVEMMVVVAIFLILAVMVTIVTLEVQNRDNVPKGARTVLGTLLQAKTRARAENVPSGVRLIGAGDQLEFVQVPDPFRDGYLTTPSANSSTVNNPKAGVDFLLAVQPEDMLELNGGGQLYRINAVTATSLTLDNAVPYKVEAPVNTKEANYRIYRQPRPLPGEEPVKLAEHVYIDFNRSILDSTANNLTATGGIDIVFSPSGSVMGTAAAYNVIYLWVQDRRPDYAENQALVVIYTKTGAVLTFKVDKSNPPTSWYDFGKTGKGGGGI